LKKTTDFFDFFFFSFIIPFCRHCVNISRGKSTEKDGRIATIKSDKNQIKTGFIGINQQKNFRKLPKESSKGRKIKKK